MKTLIFLCCFLYSHRLFVLSSKKLSVKPPDTVMYLCYPGYEQYHQYSHVSLTARNVMERYGLPEEFCVMMDCRVNIIKWENKRNTIKFRVDNYKRYDPMLVMCAGRSLYYISVN